MSTMRRRPYITTRTHEVFAIAHDLADRLGHDDVTPVHLTLGLVREGRSVAAAIPHARSVPLDALERELAARLPPPRESRALTREHTWLHSDERVLEQASVEGHELGAEFIGCEHVLLAFLRDPSSAPAQVLAQHGVRYHDARTDVLPIYHTRADGSTAVGS